MRRTSFNQSCRPITGRKANHCLISPSNQSSTAVTLERRKNCWFIRTNVASDLIINVEDSIFHLHKVPMISKSEYLNRLVFQRRNKGETDSVLSLHMDNLPGGAQIFELVVKFCYGLPIDLTVANIAPLYCTAHFLQMNEDFELGNLVSKIETFLSFITFSSWKDTIQILKSCENVSSWPEELVKRCSESIAWKASLDPKAIFSGDHIGKFDRKNSKNNGKNNNGGSGETGLERWWFEDVSVLRIDHFVEFINAVKMKKMRSSLVGSCIAYWASKNLPTTIKHWINSKQKNEIQRVAVERLIMILPVEESSFSCGFLLHLLKVGVMIDIDCKQTENLERRVAMMLENCSVGDLIVKNYGDDENAYDVSLVVRVVKAYVTFFSSNSTARMYSVANVVDEYLTLVAKNDKLSVKSFTLLAEALPESARYCDDKLYMAIDMYLKSHPTLAEEERRSVCRFMDYHKLSLEARDHAMKNDRLPLNITVKFILLEQVNMTRSILAAGSNFGRTKSQAIVRRNIGKRWVKVQKELVLIKEEIETTKIQLNDLQTCRGHMKNQMEHYLPM